MADESRIVKDPICGKEVDTLRARAVGIFGGVTHYFCSAECKAKYRDPRQQASADWTGPERRVAEPAPRAPDLGAIATPEPKSMPRPAAPKPLESKPVAAKAAVPKPAAPKPMESKPAPAKAAVPKAAAPQRESRELEIIEEPRRRTPPVTLDDDAALDVPARRSFAWIAVVLTLLMAAAAVLLFTLRK
jgi:YHS domain-containing protein